MGTTDDIKHKYQDMIQSVKTERDELRVKMHLANLEVQEEWAVVEKKWDQFKHKTGELEGAASESSHELGEALSILGDELKQSYRRFKSVVAKH